MTETVRKKDERTYNQVKKRYNSIMTASDLMNVSRNSDRLPHHLPIIAIAAHSPNLQESRVQPYLFQETRKKVCSSYQAYHCPDI